MARFRFVVEASELPSAAESVEVLLMPHEENVPLNVATVTPDRRGVPDH